MALGKKWGEMANCCFFKRKEIIFISIPAIYASESRLINTEIVLAEPTQNLSSVFLLYLQHNLHAV